MFSILNEHLQVVPKVRKLNSRFLLTLLDVTFYRRQLLLPAELHYLLRQHEEGLTVFVVVVVVVVIVVVVVVVVIVVVVVVVVVAIIAFIVFVGKDLLR